MNFGVMLPGMLSGFVLKYLGGYENFFHIRACGNRGASADYMVCAVQIQ